MSTAAPAVVSRWPKGWRRPKATADWVIQAVYTFGYVALLFLWAPAGNMLMVWAGGIFALGGVVLTEFTARCENRRLVHTVQVILWVILFLLTIRQHNREENQ
jgi:hypothetical protein